MNKQHLVEDQEMKTLQSDGRDIAYIKGRICHIRPDLTEAEKSAVKIFALKGNALGTIRHATDQLFEREDGNERLLKDMDKMQPFSKVPVYFTGELLCELLGNAPSIREITEDVTLVADGSQAEVIYRGQEYYVKVKPKRGVQ